MTDAFITTPEGAHAKAKELGIKAYNLGCSCYNCNKEFDEIIKEFDEIMNRKPDVIKAALSVGKQLSPKFINTACKIDNMYAKQIWNEAIEAAANLKMFQDGWISEAIRELKK